MDKRVPSIAFTRIALIVIVPIAIVAGIRAVAWAINLKTWSAGETLTSADLNANFDAIKTEINVPAWTAVAFSTGWGNYPDVMYGGAEYRKIGTTVYLRGFVSGADFAANAGIFTFPAGYRPLKRRVFSADCKSSLHCRVDVLADGSVISQANSGMGYLSLDGMVFNVD